MAASNKDTIYVDIDDEITGIIDKVRASDGKLVALVLPKRASTFQSIVNMKLLKRAADSEKKHLVLITSEAGLLPLAGAAGVHVAKTLTSKPEIPAAPALPEEPDEAVDEDEAEALDPDAPVGQLAGAAAADGVETLVLDDEDLPPEADAPAGPKTFEPPAKTKKNKKLAVPNFERFRLLLVAGALLLILLIGGLIFALTALPKAVIAIKTNATTVDVNLGLNLSTTATQLKASDGTVPAKLAQQQKTYTQQVPTTGQKNNGNKASGTMSVTAGSCGPDVPEDVPAGSGFYTSSNQTYITQERISFTPTISKGKCIFQGIDNDGDNGISIIAQSGGSSFNIPGSTSFKLNGRSELSGSGSASGGTDSIVQTVNQNDINSAKAKIAADNSVKQALQADLKRQDLYPIDATYQTGTPTVTTSADVGDVANNVTVTETITYTMFGVRKDDLVTLIEHDIKSQVDTAQRTILDNGLDGAVFNVDNLTPTTAQLTMSATGAVGPDLNIDDIKAAAAGKKSGAVKSDLEANPDVTEVSVKLSPFWVSSVPKKTSKIHVEIAKPQASAKASSNGNNP